LIGKGNAEVLTTEGYKNKLKHTESPLSTQHQRWKTC